MYRESKRQGNNNLRRIVMKIGITLLVLAGLSFIGGTWVEQFSDNFYTTGCIFFIPGLMITMFSYLEG